LTLCGIALCVWLVTSCGQGASSNQCGGEGPPPDRPQCIYQSSEEACELAVRARGQDSFSSDPAVRKVELRNFAQEFAKDFETNHRSAVRGCLAGLRLALGDT
jgi:hypothetical protein